MGEKSKEKKKYILEKARDVFAQKGYKNVTMKDVVEACDISRGGLYLYFDGVENLFLEVLHSETGKGSGDLQKALSGAGNNTDVLSLFLKEQKKEILREKNSLSVAIYEYSFSKGKGNRENKIYSQYEQGRIFLERLLSAGVSAGEFCVTDATEAAKHILYLLEGMKILSQNVTIREEEVDAELVRILKELLPV